MRCLPNAIPCLNLSAAKRMEPLCPTIKTSLIVGTKYPKKTAILTIVTSTTTPANHYAVLFYPTVCGSRFHPLIQSP